MASAALNPEIVQNSLSSLDKGTNLVPNGEPAEEGGSSTTSHFNDWPNEAGVRSIRSNIERTNLILVAVEHYI